MISRLNGRRGRKLFAGSTPKLRLSAIRSLEKQGTRRSRSIAGQGPVLNGFKDEYRNLCSHVRAKSDELQTLRALQKVHEFMGRLSLQR